MRWIVVCFVWVALAVLNVCQQNVHAGVLFVGVLNETLYVICDDGDDEIELRPGSNSTSVQFRYTILTGDIQVFQFANITNVVASLGAGENKFVSTTDILGDLAIIGGDDDDEIALILCSVGGDTFIDSGDGSNSVDQFYAVFGGSFSCEGAGSFGRWHSGGAEFHGPVDITVRPANSVVQRTTCWFTPTFCTDNVTIEFGMDANELNLIGDFDGNLTVRGSGLDDAISIHDCNIGGDLSIETYHGEDDVRMFQDGVAGVVVQGAVLIDTGTTKDIVEIESTVIHKKLTIRTSKGHDIVSLISSSFLKGLNVDLGAGNDDLFVSSVWSPFQNGLGGGSGFDSGYYLGSALGRLTRLSFEQGNLSN